MVSMVDPVRKRAATSPVSPLGAVTAAGSASKKSSRLAIIRPPPPHVRGTPAPRPAWIDAPCRAIPQDRLVADHPDPSWNGGSRPKTLCSWGVKWCCAGTPGSSGSRPTSPGGSCGQTPP